MPQACNGMLDETFNLALIVRNGFHGHARMSVLLSPGPELSFCARTSVQTVDEFSFHQAFIGPLDLNAQFLELAVKRGSRETQDVSAFFYVAGGAFEGLSDRFTLNLLHRH